jgi:hypothetical protein
MKIIVDDFGVFWKKMVMMDVRDPENIDLP